MAVAKVDKINILSHIDHKDKILDILYDKGFIELIGKEKEKEANFVNEDKENLEYEIAKVKYALEFLAPRKVDDRKFLEDLFMPLSILTINTIWLPDGTTETRVILKRKRGSQLPFDLKALKEIAYKVRKMSLRVEFAN